MRDLDLTSSSLSDVPHEFLCPITLDIMTDPVVTADGHTYERSVIEEHLRKSNISPKTNKPLENKILTPNYSKYDR